MVPYYKYVHKGVGRDFLCFCVDVFVISFSWLAFFRHPSVQQSDGQGQLAAHNPEVRASRFIFHSTVDRSSVF